MLGGVAAGGTSASSTLDRCHHQALSNPGKIKNSVSMVVVGKVKVNQLERSLAISTCTGMITTLGGDGAEYNGKLYPAPKVEVVDVCGAGDTFLAALAYKFLETNDIELAIQFAIRAGSLTVEHSGNYAPKLIEI